MSTSIDTDILDDLRESKRARKMEKAAEKARNIDDKPEKPEKPSTLKSIVNRMKGKETKRTSEIKLANIAFHHAGYDPKSFNTVMFRLKGSKDYDGGVMAGLIHLFFCSLTDDDTQEVVFVSRTRGGEPLSLRGNTIFWDSDLYLHVPNPEDPTDQLWKYPLLPTLTMWQISLHWPINWDNARKAMKKTNSVLKFSGLSMDTDLDLVTFCYSSVLERDQNCILSGVCPSKCERAYVVPLRLRYLWVEQKMGNIFEGKSFTRGANSLLNAAIKTCAKRQRLNVSYDAATDMYHPMNGILLRTDLAKAYDNGDFILMPEGDRWMAHFFDSNHALANEFDHKTAKISQDISRTLLLVRPAMIAFRNAEEFINQAELKPALKKNKTSTPSHQPVQNTAESPGLLL